MSQVGENLKYKSKYFLWTKVKDRLVHFLCRPQSVYKTVASKIMICLVKSSQNVTNSYIIAHLCIYTLTTASLIGGRVSETSRSGLWFLCIAFN